MIVAPAQASGDQVSSSVAGASGDKGEQVPAEAGGHRQWCPVSRHQPSNQHPGRCDPQQCD